MRFTWRVATGYGDTGVLRVATGYALIVRVARCLWLRTECIATGNALRKKKTPMIIGVFSEIRDARIT